MKTQSKRLGGIAVCAAMVIWGVNVIPTCAAEMFFPGKDWSVVAPKEESVDAAKLAKAVEYLRKNSGPDGVHELVIIRNGRCVKKTAPPTTAARGTTAAT